MSLYQKVLLPAMAAYGRWHKDDERAHELALGLIAALTRVPGLMRLLECVTGELASAKGRTAFGLTFPAPVGLAAGLDKEGVGLPFWPAIGFGFVEVGTVPPYRQPGNGRPRLFRLDEERMLINRMGFNSSGMGRVRSNVFEAKHRGLSIPIGISLGANKKTLEEDPANAKYDYSTVGKEFLDVADFNVVNVSSPNTPGLRELQGRAYIEDLLNTTILSVRGYAVRLAKKNPPLLVKISPDLTIDEFNIILDAAVATGASGIVIANTTLTRPWDTAAMRGPYAEAGGASGHDWLYERALELCRHARARTPSLAIVMAGGINSPGKAIRALEVADLIEVLTGFVFQGPALIRAIRRVRVPEPALLARAA